MGMRHSGHKPWDANNNAVTNPHFEGEFNMCASLMGDAPTRQSLTDRQTIFHGKVYTFTQRGRDEFAGYIRLKGKTISGERGNATGTFYPGGRNADFAVEQAHA